MSAFAEFFRTITGNEPLPYQLRYAAAPYENTLMIVPTGLGKTDAAITPFLYASAESDPARPTRLFYILPRQNLTEQTGERVRLLVAKAGLKIRVIQCMGGSRDNDVNLSPAEPAIVVGTQDILVSRALNRGYARHPFRWPIDFALLNNDCQWILDEVQLMSDSLATSTQLAAFRDRFGAFGRTPVTWMSATADPLWLKTVDFASLSAGTRMVTLGPDDYRMNVVEERVNAVKSLNIAPASCRTPQGCAEFAAGHHRAGSSTAVIANTVRRAVEIAKAVTKVTGAKPLLIHSRFRPHERSALAAQLADAAASGRMVVSTQVLEAGVDISFQRLITDVAPWGSLVQRFGRVNRYGKEESAEIWVVDRPLNGKLSKLADADADALSAKEVGEIFSPYKAPECVAALELASGLANAAPICLPDQPGPTPYQHVLRKSDILDLFDTSADLAGNHIDVSRFVRSSEERTCFVGWLPISEESSLTSLRALDDEELCPVPIGELREFCKARRTYQWDFIDGEWRPLDRDNLYPGLVVLAAAEQGGYTDDEGWSPQSRLTVNVVAAISAETPESSSDDRLSVRDYRQTLAEHSEMVLDELRVVMKRLVNCGLEPFRNDLELAATLHDWGKAHPVFQRTMYNGNPSPELLAKQFRGLAAHRHGRPHFRHELASTLAMMAADFPDLPAYLVAAHHGRIRAVLRSMPGEQKDTGEISVRGIRDGDEMPACRIAGYSLPGVVLHLDVVQLGRREAGRPSWVERSVRLRDSVGPFKLAYLEMLLRAADGAASERGKSGEGS